MMPATNSQPASAGKTWKGAGWSGAYANQPPAGGKRSDLTNTTANSASACHSW
jgi:hypothetical protein